MTAELLENSVLSPLVSDTISMVYVTTFVLALLGLGLVADFEFHINLPFNEAFPLLNSDAGELDFLEFFEVLVAY